MLMLTRKEGEFVLIGDGITVLVDRITGGRVRIGFTAPPNVKIIRGELCPELMEAEKEKKRQALLAQLEELG